jgi:signal transduction histidine kinase
MTVLYSRLTSALTMQRRDHLVSIDAATAAIAHEVRTPLGAITLNASTARQLVLAQPSRLEELNEILKDIEAASLRVGATIASVRGLFKEAADQPTKICIEDVARHVLRLLQHELQFNRNICRDRVAGRSPFGECRSGAITAGDFEFDQKRDRGHELRSCWQPPIER